MIGLDTNVVVRLFVDDDPVQAERARAFVAARCSPAEPGFVNRVSLCETVWVLRGFGYGRAEIAGVVEALAGARDILVEDADAVRAALAGFRATNIDFADLLIAETNRARGCAATATFDRKALKLPLFAGVSLP
ncbi:MAG TPA: type II toxin-antitoxin system VapC family toxin [Bauldia sp.]|nr:type II toxin-antitoxin system VapC family toxin [Bauldia sp.]